MDVSENYFSPQDVIMPRCWFEGFADEEVLAEIIDAVRHIIRSSDFLSKKMFSLRSHLKFAEAVLHFIRQCHFDFQGFESDVKRNQLFAKLLEACSHLCSLDIDIPSVTSGSANTAFDIGIVASKNRRRSMEDQYIIMPNLSFWPSIDSENKCPECAFFAVMDGHGGQHASSYVARHLPQTLHQNLTVTCNSDYKFALKKSVFDVERMFCNRAIRLGHGRVGSTLVASLIDPESGRGYVSWLGDSRADIFIFRRHEHEWLSSTKCLTEPLHRPGNVIEKSRIESVGGFVSGGGNEDIARVNGQLGVSRSIGDYDYKKGSLISNEPEFTDFAFNFRSYRLNSLEILMLSSDGLWDGLSVQDIQSIININLKKELYKSNNDWLNIIARELVSAASLISDDNITCILISPVDSIKV